VHENPAGGCAQPLSIGKRFFKLPKEKRLPRRLRQP
jgi:hypothetical protein